MNVTSRSYLTAGVAALTAGAIALTPVQPIPNQLVQAPERAVSNLTVSLAAAIDPITPWADAIATAAANAYDLQNTWWADPFPIVRQIIQNQQTYFSEFPNIGLIVQQVLANIPAAIKAPFATNPENVNPAVVPGSSPEGYISQQGVYGILTSLIPTLEKPLSLLTSPLSGFLLGFAGPGLSSMLQIRDTIANILKPPPGANWLLNAINETINLPANLFNAAFNGGKYLDLTALVNKIAGPLPGGITLDFAGLRTGGFLNAGGVAFDSLAAEAGGVPVFGNIVDPGWSVGFIGATGSLATAVANAIKVVPPTPGAAKPAAVKAAAAEAVEAPTAAGSSDNSTDPAPVSDAKADDAVAGTSVGSEAPAPKRQARRGGGSDNAPKAAASQRTRRAG